MLERLSAGAKDVQKEVKRELKVRCFRWQSGLCVGLTCVRDRALASWWAAAPVNGIECLMPVPTADGSDAAARSGRLESLPAVTAMPAVQDAVRDLDQRKPGVGGEIPS